MPIWSTQGLPEQAQFGFWREVICEAFAALDPHPRAQQRAFPSQVALSSFGAVNAGHIASCAQVVHRGAREIRLDPQDRLFINLQLAGIGRVRQGERSCEVPEGSFCVVDTARPYRLEFDGDFQVLSFRIPRQHLLPLMAHPQQGDPFARTFSGAHGGGRLATGFMRLLADEAESLPVARRGDLAIQLCHLVAGAVEAQTATAGGVATASRGSFLRTALEYLETRAADPDLSVVSLAWHFGVSERYVQKIFAAAGITVARHLRALRLERCARDLSRPGERRSVVAIATGHGFADMPHFTRVFTRRFGCSPGRYRRSGSTVAADDDAP